MNCNNTQEINKSENSTQEQNTKYIYKNILLNGVMVRQEHKSETNLLNLDIFLENEKNNNINEPWSKLDKTIKMKKLLVYAENYKQENSLNDAEYNEMLVFFKDCLNKKKIQRVKDVIYDKTTGIVKDIPGLLHNKVKNHFTIKNLDKRVSTLKSLAPKKYKGTVKNTSSTKDETSDSE